MPATARSLASRPLSLLNADSSPAEADVLRLAARAAEDAGDFHGALRLISGLPDGRATRHWQRQLMDVIGLAPEDGAGLACWLVHPAVRSALEKPTGEIFERYAALMLKTMGVGPEHRSLRVSAVASNDPVVVDTALFDTGRFAAYLETLVGSPLLLRLGEVSSWPMQAALVWQVVAMGADEVVLRDLWADRDVRARRYPGAEALALDAIIYGRLVPVAGDPSSAFVLPPAKIDLRCATRLLRARRQGSGPEERLRAVGHSRRRAIQAGELRL